MTAPVDRAKQGRANRNRGAVAERRLAGYLRDHGFPNAERAIRAAYIGADHVLADPGDITGTPGLVWQVKDCATERIAVWLDDTDRQRAESSAVYGLLVVRRRGHADPGGWWCWLTMATLVDLIDPGDTRVFRETGEAAVRLELWVVVQLLRAGGWSGDDVTVSR